MKKVIASILAVVMLLFLVACGTSEGTKAALLLLPILLRPQAEMRAAPLPPNRTTSRPPLLRIHRPRKAIPVPSFRRIWRLCIVCRYSWR